MRQSKILQTQKCEESRRYAAAEDNKAVKLFVGYTFTHAEANYLTGNQILPLTPKSRINSALLFEREADFKTGLEAYYTSSQI